ncbi:MAG TPA: HDIG domain-containing protein, partial [Gemmatimonadaceae bacterium]|nr:HDIG domain-containing protein [Gemmatimonadaceae bacterium]
MNLWRQLESKITAQEPGQPSTKGVSSSFMPRLDVALTVSAAVARIILDPRVSFAAAIVLVIFVPAIKGRILAAVLVAVGSLLVYRAPRWGHIPSHLRWLAWADLNKPLLRRLSLEAPGTYAHTIAIANLCEAACNAVGVDGLLGRVGAYYHDIGKLRKPQHFIENQSRGRNPHDKLKPGTSAAIIRGHVRDGLELAEEAGVPREIRAFITEHHGTMPIAYFLEKARERDGAAVNLAEFTYPGPIPQTIETAICMLSDGVEARMHTLVDPTPATIAEVVDSI